MALNAQLQPHRLTKTYPNFPGDATNAAQPQFGWRMGNWVPDYASFLAPDHFDESISLIVREPRGLSGIRQGFWPSERPKPGKREIAQIELVANPPQSCAAEVYVLLHEGHQVVAKRLRGELDLPQPSSQRPSFTNKLRLFLRGRSEHGLRDQGAAIGAVAEGS